jgi:hypothetical protein
MLQINVAIFAALLAISVAVISALRVTLNGVVPTHKTDYANCMVQIGNLLGENMPNLITVLDNHFHCIAPIVDKANFISKRLHVMTLAILLNIILLFLYWYFYTILVDSFHISTEESLRSLQIVPILGFITGASTILFGLSTILRVDGFEEMGKIARFNQLKKIREKL